MELLNSAYGLAGILDLEFDTKMITYAIEIETERAAWDMWTAALPKVKAEDMLPFSEFKSKAIKKAPKTTQKSFEEITEEMLVVVEQHKEKKRRRLTDGDI